MAVRFSAEVPMGVLIWRHHLVVQWAGYGLLQRFFPQNALLSRSASQPQDGRSMAQDDPAHLPELSPEDAHGPVVWRPSPDRRRLVLRWTLRCLVAGAVVAGAWSLRNQYPRIDLSVTGPAKQVQETRTHVGQPMVSKPKERFVVKEPPRKPLPEWRPPLDTRSVVR